MKRPVGLVGCLNPAIIDDIYSAPKQLLITRPLGPVDVSGLKTARLVGSSAANTAGWWENEERVNLELDFWLRVGGRRVSETLEPAQTPLAGRPGTTQYQQEKPLHQHVCRVPA